jgi:uncharacterized MAPEG superfamily protein
MTLAYWCILIAVLLPYLTVALAKIKPGYNNRSPREWEDALEGWRKRAVHAHVNHFEAFAPFAAGVIVAHLARAPQGTIDGIAIVFILARIGYTGAYLAGKPLLRSLIWLVGFGCVIALFAVAATSR